MYIWPINQRALCALCSLCSLCSLLWIACADTSSGTRPLVDASLVSKDEGIHNQGAVVPDQGMSEGVSDQGMSDQGVSDQGVSDQGMSDQADQVLASGDASMNLVDIDGDGYSSVDDCDDRDSTRYPGAIERCNGLDDDCDDRFDEDASDASTWYRDFDEDAQGDQDTTITSCAQPDGYVERPGDCNDLNALISSDQAEVCDGVDNNCDDIVDNGVPNDGGGCLDLGRTERPAWAEIAQLTVRNGGNAGDDGSLIFKLRSGARVGSDPVLYSNTLNNAQWDDHMRYTVDVYTIPLPDMRFPEGTLAGGSGVLEYEDSDAWAFACVQLTLNGINVYCREYPSEITLDAGADEEHSFTLPDPLPIESLPCTCYDRYLSHGPIIGDTDHDHVRIWGRTDATRRVRLRLGRTVDTMATVAYRYGRTEQDHTFEFDIFGLEPSTTYTYALDVADESTLGTFTTAPAPGASGEYTFAVGSCAKTVPHRHPEQPIFSAISDKTPDMMFMLGDNVYFDSLTNGATPDVGAMRNYYRDGIQRRGSWAPLPDSSVYDPLDPAARPSSSDRSAWWGLFGRDARADLFSSTPILAIWDDHDFYSNNADAFYDDDRGRKPWTLDSIRLFDDYWPNPDGGLSPDQVSEMGIYFKHSWGDVDIFGLDTRFHRDDSREHMLGRAQMDWLKRELSASTATFKFILSGSIFAGDTDDDEKWPHFEAELAELFNHIWGQGVGGVLLMSGDIHSSAVLTHRNPNNPDDPYVIHEVISSGLANYGPSIGILSSTFTSPYDSLVQMNYMAPFPYDRRETNVFALVSADTTLEDPELSVTFYNELGFVACRDCPLRIKRSVMGPR